MGTSKRQITEEERAATQLESIIVQSVSYTRLCADIIKQGQGFLRKYALMSYKAKDPSRG